MKGINRKKKEEWGRDKKDSEARDKRTRDVEKSN